jgi:hypothetical protein
MSDFRVTLLGTGTPIPVPDRFGPSTLVEAGDQKLLFDAERGASIRLHQLGVPIGSIDALLMSLLGSSRRLAAHASRAAIGSGADQRRGSATD